MRQALEDLIEVVEAAISAGDWKVDGACEPTLALVRAKRALAQPEQEPVTKYCCHLCFNKSGQLFLDRMIVCPECGNKRCPKATHHELLCTNSNESNQTGSIYTTPPQRKPLTDGQIWDLHIKMSVALDCKLSDLIEMTRAIEAAHGIKE